MPHTDPAARRAQRRKKYAEDAEYREKLLASNRRWAAANPERDREIKRRSHDKHREKRNAYSRAYIKAHPDKSRLSTRKASGITGATGEAREGECPICLKVGPLVCDHDHETGRIRGWICKHCNMGIGQIGDSLEAVRRAVAYLENGV